MVGKPEPAAHRGDDDARPLRLRLFQQHPGEQFSTPRRKSRGNPPRRRVSSPCNPPGCRRGSGTAKFFPSPKPPRAGSTPPCGRLPPATRPPNPAGLPPPRTRRAAPVAKLSIPYVLYFKGNGRSNPGRPFPINPGGYYRFASGTYRRISSPILSQMVLKEFCSLSVILTTAVSPFIVP